MDEKAQGQCFFCGVVPQLSAMAAAMAKSVLPTDALEHFKASQVEFLKGVRHLLDAKIQKMSTGKTHGTSIPVD